MIIIKKVNLIFVEGSKQGLDMGQNIHCLQKKCIQLILLKIIKTGTSSYLFFNVGEVYKFKAKDSETAALYILHYV